LKPHLQNIPEITVLSSKENLPVKECYDCGKKLTFQEFFRNNPSLSSKRAYNLWEDPLITLYCPHCFFNRPEKPFKLKRRNFKMILKE
jgi:hypothetical protein